jgi:hypothetical protein
MTIACLGWGSLIWDPRSLPIRPPWKPDGPMLPIEFARHSSSERVTLVLEPRAQPVQTLWVPLSVASLADAREALRQREGTVPKFIASWSPADLPGDETTRAIGHWATKRDLVGVVWTALPPKWNGKQGLVPTIDQLLQFLKALGPESAAEQYVRKTPAQVQTAYRARLESDLGWTFLNGPPPPRLPPPR